MNRRSWSSANCFILVQIRQQRWAFDPAPSVTAIAVSALARPEYLIEIEAVASAAMEQSP